jgi:hypothetical protein
MIYSLTPSLILLNRLGDIVIYLEWSDSNDENTDINLSAIGWSLYKVKGNVYLSTLNAVSITSTETKTCDW